MKSSVLLAAVILSIILTTVTQVDSKFHHVSKKITSLKARKRAQEKRIAARQLDQIRPYWLDNPKSGKLVPWTT